MSKSNTDTQKIPFFKGIKTEWKKITWTDSKSLLKQSVVVAVSAIVVGAIIALVDYLVQNGLDLLFNITF